MGDRKQDWPNYQGGALNVHSVSLRVRQGYLHVAESYSLYPDGCLFPLQFARDKGHRPETPKRAGPAI